MRGISPRPPASRLQFPRGSPRSCSTWPERSSRRKSAAAAVSPTRSRPAPTRTLWIVLLLLPVVPPSSLQHREENAMPVRTSYAQGTPNWVDLQTTDQAAAKAFYAGVFGWSYDDQPMDGDAVYSIAKIGDESVAAIAPQSPELVAAGAPSMWNTYLAVDSVDEVSAKVGPAGGTVAMEPFDVMDAGRMAFVLDPSGAAVALWQAGQHIGSSLLNEPGTGIWNRLITDSPAAVSFYDQDW